MTSGYSDCSKLSSKPCMCWTIREGYVQIISENHVPVTRYLKAKCGIVEDWPARLECYEVAKSTNEKESMLWRIYFTNVEYVKYTEKRQKGFVIVIGMQKGNKIPFYADSDTSTMQWYDFCSLLSKIPKYAIPRIPKENVALQQEIIRYNDLHDAGNKWMVDILDKGIGYTKRIFGLCVVYICNSSSTFNIYDFHNGKRLLCWNRDDIGLSGCLNSLIFVEVKEPWHGGPGLLWMQHPTRQSATLQKQIHNFLYARPKERRTPSPVSYVFVDSAMSHAHIRDDTDPELSQTPYEDQLSDISSSLNTPVSQSASLSSGSSRLSSGYYSDSSYGESISSRSSQLSYPKVTSKYMPDKAEKDSPILNKPAVVSSSPIQATSPTISNDKHGHSSLQNAFIQREITPSPNIHRKSASLQNHVAIPPHSSSTKKTKIPKPSRSASSQCASSSCHVPNTLSTKDPINSSSKQATGTTLAWINHQLSKNAFRICSDIIDDNLDVSEIFPQLNSQGLLTEEDCQILSNNHITDKKKIQHLLYVLPRKESRFFEKFMYCLGKTIKGTGHGDILEALVANYNEEVKKGSSGDMSLGYIKVTKHHSKK